jgi:hypothetical protein
MSEQLPTVNPSSGLGNVINKIINYVKSHTIIPSDDFVTKRTTHGTTLSLAEHLKNFPTQFVNYKEEFDPNASYNVYDIVRAHSSSYVAYNSSSVSCSIGTWICVAGIANLRTSDALLANGFSQGGQLTRVTGVNYAPVDPEPPYTFEDVSASSVLLTRNTIRYWELLFAASTPIIKEVVLLSEAADTLTCQDGAGTIYQVGKPWPLRQSTTNTQSGSLGAGASITSNTVSTRTVSASFSGHFLVEPQAIQPTYRVGEYIMIEKVPASEIGLVGLDTLPVVWTDRNEAGRAWGSTGQIYT